NASDPSINWTMSNFPRRSKHYVCSSSLPHDLPLLWIFQNPHASFRVRETRSSRLAR
ncbi:hypothetical protein ACJX0J_025355, partial [Zea mays]